MSRLVSKLLLAMLLFPMAALLYLAICVLGRRVFTSWRSESSMFASAGVITWVAMGFYWWLLWRDGVRWTSGRVAVTVLVTVAALGTGAGLGAIADSVARGFGYFLGSVAAPLIWLVATVFVWRETAEERAERFRGSSPQSILCPTCGYNLTGLSEARCPECGTRFTISELLAMQKSREGSELGE